MTGLTTSTPSTITTGVTGRPWRASITPWGEIVPWDEGPSLDWFVAADDRWHVPAQEPAVRQRRIEGTPVTETRVRVPNGDVVQRVYSVADAGGLTIVEVENESTMPVAVAFGHRRLLTERPIAEVPIEGIDLPPEAFVMPVAHTATVRVAIPHDGSGGRFPSAVPTPTQVVRGWQALLDRASRLVLPDGPTGSSLAESVAAARCEMALGSFPAADDDPVGFAIALGELVRMGEPPDAWMPELVDAVEAVGPQPGWSGDVALRAAERVVHAAGEQRAARDLARIAGRRTPSVAPAEPPTGPALIPWTEERLARGGELLPNGLPSDWLGQSLDVYGIPTGAARSVSFAIRWHGERPAVLWEQTGGTQSLTAPVVAPGWTTDEVSGEALWPPPPDGPATVGEPIVAPSPDGPISFT